ncbi:hypothetical protein, partial [Lacticaseibacillus mingshuiensis]
YSFSMASFSSAVCFDLGIQKSLHDYQMNYCISSDNHKGIIANAPAFLRGSVIFVALERTR